MNIEQKVEEELTKLPIISKGITVMVILISLEDAFTEEFSKIPDTYSIMQSENIVEDPLWKLSLLFFPDPADDQGIVEKYLKGNGNL